MPLISLKHNYFMPTMMLVKKCGSAVSEEKKQAMVERKASLSYLKLLQEITKLRLKLDQWYHKKYNLFLEDNEE